MKGLLLKTLACAMLATTTATNALDLILGRISDGARSDSADKLHDQLCGEFYATKRDVDDFQPQVDEIEISNAVFKERFHKASEKLTQMERTTANPNKYYELCGQALAIVVHNYKMVDTSISAQREANANFVSRGEDLCDVKHIKLNGSTTSGESPSVLLDALNGARDAELRFLAAMDAVEASTRAFYKICQAAALFD